MKWEDVKIGGIYRVCFAPGSNHVTKDHGALVEVRRCHAKSMPGWAYVKAVGERPWSTIPYNIPVDQLCDVKELTLARELFE
jgi:hypothetical protein